MCARKTTRKDETDPQQVIVNPFPWHKVKVADEASVITDVATFLYPEDMGVNGQERKQARERVRSAKITTYTVKYTVRRVRCSGTL